MIWAGAKSPGPTQDRLLMLDLGSSWVFAAVDGAGGMSGGACAAEVTVEVIARLARDASARDLVDAGFWCLVLAECDAAVLARADAGEAAAAVLCVTGADVAGASVGDCMVWAFAGATVEELTRGQRRRPMLGDGGARPWPLASCPDATGWALGTDGVVACGRGGEVGQVWRGASGEGAAARALVELGRDRGGFVDDVAVWVVGLGSAHR